MDIMDTKTVEAKVNMPDSETRFQIEFLVSEFVRLDVMMSEKPDLLRQSEYMHCLSDLFDRAKVFIKSATNKNNDARIGEGKDIVLEIINLRMIEDEHEGIINNPDFVLALRDVYNKAYEFAGIKPPAENFVMEII